jgi:hypothetical protein
MSGDTGLVPVAGDPTGGTTASADFSITESWRKSPLDSLPLLEPSLVSEWGRNLPEHLRRAQNIAANVVGALTGEAQTAFQSAFDSLPRQLQTHIFRELGAPEPKDVQLATDSDMALFRCVDGGTETIAFWGNEARWRVATALDRFIRIEKSVTPTGKQILESWWNSRSPREKQLCMYSLGS